jgi:hypothetical protein
MDGSGRSYGHAVEEELREPERALRQAIPEVYRGYLQLHSAVFAVGALDAHIEELMALAIAPASPARAPSIVASRASRLSARRSRTRRPRDGQHGADALNGLISGHRFALSHEW